MLGQLIRISRTCWPEAAAKVANGRRGMPSIDIRNWPIAEQLEEAKTVLQQFGTYDFQRDKATNTFFNKYIHAANYAVGVYMAGAGYGKWLSVTIAQTWGFSKRIYL